MLGSAEEGRESEREKDDKLREALGGMKAFDGREKRAAKEDEEQGCRAGGCAEEAEDGQRLMVESWRVHGSVVGISDFKFQISELGSELSSDFKVGFCVEFGCQIWDLGFELAQEEELAGLADFGGDLRGGGASATSGDFGVGDAR